MKRLALVLALISACGTSNPPPCALSATGRTTGPVRPIDQIDPLLDPSTLACQDFSYGGCESDCLDCGCCAANELAIPAPPTWGSCTSACIGLGESACRTTAGCRIAVAFDPAPTTSNYIGCYPVDMDAGAHPPCAGLEAQDCSRDDTCAATYEPTGDGMWQFVACVAESSV